MASRTVTPIGRAAQPRQIEVAAILQAADRAVVQRGPTSVEVIDFVVE